MLLALGAASSVMDALQSLTSQKPSSANQPAPSPFDANGSATASAGAASPPPSGGFSPISPQTMSALIAAQGDTSNTAPTNPSDALGDLFSLIDADGDGKITQTEFENALGAGGTNVAAADDVFGKLDSNGDGSVSLDEMKSALQGAHGHRGHHHMHAHGAGDGDGGGDGDGDGPSSDPLLQALSGASSTSVTNSDGSTTTSITYTDGSIVSLTTPAASATSSTSATSTYNLIEQLIQREAQALSTSAAASLSVSV